MIPSARLRTGCCNAAPAGRGILPAAGLAALLPAPRPAPGELEVSAATAVLPARAGRDCSSTFVQHLFMTVVLRCADAERRPVAMFFRLPIRYSAAASAGCPLLPTRATWP